jgi:hypothetical protein
MEPETVMKLTNISLAAMLALTLSGCAALRSPASVSELNSSRTHYVDLDATRRGVIIVPADTPVKICAEPAPDVAIESMAKIIADIKTADPNIDAKTQAELSTKIVELAGRTQLVLVLRESLYRLCEQGLNGNLSNEQVARLYTQVLDTILKLAQTDLAKEQKEIIDKLKDPELRRIFSGMVSLPSKEK